MDGDAPCFDVVDRGTENALKGQGIGLGALGTVKKSPLVAAVHGSKRATHESYFDE